MEIIPGTKLEILEAREATEDGLDHEWVTVTFQEFTRDEDGTPTVIYSDDDGFLKMHGLYGQQVRICEDQA